MVNARTSNLLSRDAKHRSMAFARWCALTVILFTCSDGDKSFVTMIPRSRQDMTFGSCTLYYRTNNRSSISHIFLPKHAVATQWPTRKLHQERFVTRLQCYHDWSRHKLSRRQQIFWHAHHTVVGLRPDRQHILIRKATGPIPLPCTTPLYSALASDIYSSLVWSLCSEKDFQPCE